MLIEEYLSSRWIYLVYLDILLCRLNNEAQKQKKKFHVQEHLY